MRREQVRCGSTRRGRRNPQGSTSRPEALAADCPHPARGHSLDGTVKQSTEGQTFLLTPHTGCFCTGHRTCPLGCQTQIKRQTRLVSLSFFSNASSKSLPPITLPAPGRGKKKPKANPIPMACLGGEGMDCPELQGPSPGRESSQVQSCVGNSALVSHADDSEAKYSERYKQSQPQSKHRAPKPQHRLSRTALSTAPPPGSLFPRHCPRGTSHSGAGS